MSNKPKCPVFGCTIPRGIPHEHPAGTYMVMRDPVAPMSRHERAHIKALSDALQHGTGFTLDGKYVPNSDVYVVPADAKIVGGRKLTQALLEAGRPRREGLEQKLIAAGFDYPMSKEDAVKAYTAQLAPRTDSIDNQDCEWCYGAGHDPYGDPCVGCCELKPVKPSRSFLRTTARIAFWIVLAVTVCIWIFAGVKS